MQNYRTVAFSLVSALILLTSCSDNYFKSDEDTPATGRTISFCASDRTGQTASRSQLEATDTFSLVDPDEPSHVLHCQSYEIPLEAPIASRVSATTQASQITEIGVIADATWFAPRLMNNDLYTRSDDGVYSSDNVRYWIDDADATIDFYAFAPYNPTGLTLPSAKGSTTLSYTVPESPDKQVDLMLAVSKGVRADYGQAVGLAFKHLLAGVKINFDYPATSEITEVSLTGLTKSATLDFAANEPQWVMGDDHSLTVKEFEIGQSAQFMVLPQALSEEQPVTLSVTIIHENGGERTYTHKFTSGEWRMAMNTVYDVKITNYSFELTNSVSADAHYVIYKTDIKSANLPANTQWTVTCSANDNADITIQQEADVNSFAKGGFWTDKIIDGSNQTSARGTNSLTLTGNGTFPVYIFMPENATEQNRTVTLNIRVNGKSINEEPLELTQLHPAWTTSGFGWEQTDDNINGEYGFKWNLVLYYGYVYSTTIAGNNTYRDYCQSIIDDNNAQSYASVEMYTSGFGQRRYAIKIDYGNLSDIGTRANSNTNGQSNTIGLYNYGGAAATNAFVTTIESIKKTESGHETENAFRLGDGTSGEAPNVEGDPVSGSTAVGECIKKNRYNLKRTLSSQGEVTLTAEISDADIVWYLPAVDQFNNIPTDIVDPINAASYWSSTCIDDRANAYLGNGAQADRLTTHSIRAIRNRP